MANESRTQLPVLIVGAGVAGLALAQGLHLRSVPFLVFERKEWSSDAQGHRFRLNKDSLHALAPILSPELTAILEKTAPKKGTVFPRVIDARDGQFGPVEIPEGHTSLPADRAWMRSVLSVGIEDRIEYGVEFSSYKVTDGEVTATFANGTSVQGCLLVGADGLRSQVRKQLQPDRRLVDMERWIIWGRTPLTPELRNEISPDVLTWFMAIDKEGDIQTVFDTVEWGEDVKQLKGTFYDYIYWAFTAKAWAPQPLKMEQERKKFIQEATAEWAPDLRMVFDAASYDLSTCVTMLSSKPDIGMRSPSHPFRVTLIGDAAHAMSPLGGSGASTAILTAVDLATTIAGGGITESSLGGFEERMERTAKEKLDYSFGNAQKLSNCKKWQDYADYKF